MPVEALTIKFCSLIMVTSLILRCEFLCRFGATILCNKGTEIQGKQKSVLKRPGFKENAKHCQENDVVSH